MILNDFSVLVSECSTIIESTNVRLNVDLPAAKTKLIENKVALEGTLDEAYLQEIQDYINLLERIEAAKEVPS